MSAPTVPQRFLNKGNNTFHIKERAMYGKPNLSLFNIAYYSMNSAMLFYVVSNVWSAYYVSTLNDSNNEKFIIYGFILLCTQIIYNWIDLNSDNNIEKLEAFT